MSHLAVVEIPKGSYNKYELTDTGELKLDWVMPIPFPTNYGSILQTVGGDGDMLDVLIVTQDPLAPKSLVDVRIIGCMYMWDDGEEDTKLIGVPVVDQSQNHISEVEQFDKDFKPRIEQFFRHIKQSVHEWTGVPIEIKGWGDAKAAQALLESSKVK